MTVDRATAPSSEAFGERFFFCCDGCRTRFDAEPARFVPARGTPRATASLTVAAPGATYVCPMDAEVSEDHAGPCPLCGMALEPRVPTTATASPELMDMGRRLRACLALTAPLVALNMGSMFTGHGTLLSARGTLLVEAALASPVVLWGGAPLFARAWTSVVRRSPNMFTLVGLGSGAAFAYSLAAALAPGLFPSGVRGPHGDVPGYFEASAVIVTLVLLGQVLELRARARTGDALRALLALAPRTARRTTARPSGDDAEVAVDTLRVGDRVRVLPGERVPVDGRVVEGSSTCNEAMITGEAMPVTKGAGDRVIGGTINGGGPLVVDVRETGEGTVLGHIARVVTDAQRSRAPVQALVDRVSAAFVPLVVAAALATFVAWMALGPEPRLAHAVVSAVSVLIIACPCALGLSTPMSIMVGVGRGAGSGVLVRNAEALSRLERVDTLLLDKTGTLTAGRPAVLDIATYGAFRTDDVLSYAAALEAQSEHPLARAILAARTAETPARRGRGVQATAGEGLVGLVDGKRIAVGNDRLLAHLGVAVAAPESPTEGAVGATLVHVVIGAEVAGTLRIGDRVKDTSKEAVTELQRAGLRLIMVTGDREEAARDVANAVGIDDVRSGLLPDEKASLVRELRTAGRTVAMAGDGINDAPALLLADVGIAMGTGTDVACASAGVTLVRGDLRGVLRARRLSVATMRNIRQNLALSFAYNALAIPVAAGALYPAFGLVLSPMIAAAAMSLSSVSVIGNALRLRSARL